MWGNQHRTNTDRLERRMSEKKIGKYWFAWGRKSGFGIGFSLSKYGWDIDLGFWYIAQEF